MSNHLLCLCQTSESAALRYASIIFSCHLCSIGEDPRADRTRPSKDSRGKCENRRRPKKDTNRQTQLKGHWKTWQIFCMVKMMSDLFKPLFIHWAYKHTHTRTHIHCRQTQTQNTQSNTANVEKEIPNIRFWTFLIKTNRIVWHAL